MDSVLKNSDGESIDSISTLTSSDESNDQFILEEDQCEQEMPKSKKRKLLHSDDVAGSQAEAYVNKHLNQYFYLNKVSDLKDMRLLNNAGFQTRSIKDVLALDQNDFIKSAQFSYIYNLEWMIQQYPSKLRNSPITVVHGVGDRNIGTIEEQAVRFRNIELVKAEMDGIYGVHHTKMMLLTYKAGMRVVILTGNMIEHEWSKKTQGIWVSELFPKISSATANSDSITGFKKYLKNYLKCYHHPKLDEWINCIEGHDMSSANVYLVGSAPNQSQDIRLGLSRLTETLLENPQINNAKKDTEQDKLVMQFTSIGRLGYNEREWFTTKLISAFGNSNNTKPLCIFPSVKDVRSSYEGYEGGNSVSYEFNNAKNQGFLKEYFCNWSSENLCRTRALPHIKSFARYSNDFSKLYWFLLTSANLSKAAWGYEFKNQTKILNYELGVMFLPSFINRNENKNYFELKSNKEFLIPYDLPPKRYDSNDEPWVHDINYSELDDFGKKRTVTK